MFGSFGLQEIIVCGLIGGLLFGAKKIPDMMSGIGKGIVDFKKSIREGKEIDGEIKKELNK